MGTPTAQIAPIPGDPAGIRAKASRFTRMAQAITDSIALLDAVAREAETQESEAVDALAGAVGNANERLNDLRQRYEVAGSQLTTFANVLEDAQRRAQDAVNARDTAAADERRLEYRLGEARDAAQSTVDPVERTDATDHARRYSNQLAGVREDLASAGAAHATALEDVRRAGDEAATAIARAIDGDGVNDSWWERYVAGPVQDWVQANAEWLTIAKTILGAITAIVGLLSLVFPVLAPIALALAVVTAVLSFALAFSGEGSWLEFGLDLIGVLTFGVGAVAAKGVGLALKGSQIMRGLTYNRQTTSLLQRIIHPVSTRRAAIAAVGDEFQSLLPTGQQLMTRMPQTTFWQRFTHEWLELSGRQVEQFRTVIPQAQLGANSLRAGLVESLGSAAVGVHRTTGGIGSALDGLGLGTFFLEILPTEASQSLPAIGDVQSAWTSVKESTAAPVGTTWQTGEAAIR
jgi:hypothetical protein